MQSAIKAEIKRLVIRNLKRANRKIEKSEEYRVKFTKRTGLPAGQAQTPVQTYPHRHFDPVYCARNANFLAKTIWLKIV